MHSEKNRHIKGFNGLRAIACFSVFIVHFAQITKVDLNLGVINITQLMENGNTGVALFFILSGFLLSLPFWNKKDHSHSGVNLFQYWIKRLCRIVPAYYVCLIGLIILQKRWDHSNALTDILLHFFFLHNLSETSIYNINPPFWTLAVEMQFYLMLPFFFYFSRSIRFKRKVVCFLMIGASIYLLNHFFIEFILKIDTWPFNSSHFPQNGNVLKKSTIAHLPHFLIGTATAGGYLHLLNKKGNYRNTNLKNDFFWLVSFLSIFVILSTPLDEILSIQNGRYNFPYIPVLIAIIVLCTPFTVYIKEILEINLIRYLGLISYGIYIYHLPLMRFVAKIMDKFGYSVEVHWLGFVSISLIITILVSSISYFVIEKYPIAFAKHYD